MATYETVIGLEIHVELATLSKAFCGCSAAFGGEPNTRCCPVCMGLPGALPVLNKRAVDYAIMAGLALGCAITPNARFDRKHYFYPDLPKAYQISQLYLPLCTDGCLTIETDGGKKTIRIREIHMEEDAGKLTHDEWANATLADMGRCGVPLIEIVTQPDLSSAEEVTSFLTKLKAILQFIGVSDCRMQEGSMRADINLSVRPIGGPLGIRTEMKNMNSLKAIARAIHGESVRQIELIEDGRIIRQETRRWDDNKDTSFPMRSKEDAQDYRYFPEPDLPPLHIDTAWIARLKAALPELPVAKQARFARDFGLSVYDTAQLTTEKTLCDLFEAASAVCGAPKETANWILGEVLALCNERGILPEALRLDPQKLGTIIRMQQMEKINRNAARYALAAALDTDTDPEAYVRENNLSMLCDTDTLAAVIETVMREHADTVRTYLAGKEKAFGFLVGQAMKALSGRADPATVNRLIREALNRLKD